MGAREDAARAEVIAKIRALAVKKGTTPDGLFSMYDEDSGGGLERPELAQLFSDAGIGNALTRGLYVSGVFDALDVDKGGTLTRAELDGVLRSVDAPPPTGKKPLTRAEARAIARRIAATDNPIDLSPFSQADVALIEEENLKLTNPPNPPPTIKRTPVTQSEGVLFAVLAVIGVLVLSRG